MTWFIVSLLCRIGLVVVLFSLIFLVCEERIFSINTNFEYETNNSVTFC